jgi:Leucine-rich repeat (LRR) protein
MNGLRSLPEAFVRLPNLEYLALSFNNISVIQDIAQAASLKSLYLEGNEITVLPGSFGKLKNLQVLYLNDNLLESLPDSFTNLAALEQLWIVDNHLKELPANFGNLKNLKFFSVFHNPISELPKTVSNLQRLELLFLPDSFTPVNIAEIRTILPRCDVRVKTN